MHNKLLVLVVVAWSSFAHGQSLQKIDDVGMVNVLNNYKIFFEERKKLPYLVRIFRVSDPGECSPNNTWCPKVNMYIAVSTFDEAPDQAVYKLPINQNWEFKGIVTWPRIDGKEHFVRVLFEENKFTSNTKKVGSNNIAISFNPYNAYFEETQ
jgi:hypothetical protein